MFSRSCIKSWISWRKSLPKHIDGSVLGPGPGGASWDFLGIWCLCFLSRQDMTLNKKRRVTHTQGLRPAPSQSQDNPPKCLCLVVLLSPDKCHIAEEEISSSLTGMPWALRDLHVMWMLKHGLPLLSLHLESELAGPPCIIGKSCSEEVKKAVPSSSKWLHATFFVFGNSLSEDLQVQLHFEIPSWIDSREK